MPTKRRRAAHHIGIALTPSALAAFIAADESALHVALHWRPWLPSPLYVHDGERPASSPSGGAARSRRATRSSPS